MKKKLFLGTTMSYSSSLGFNPQVQDLTNYRRIILMGCHNKFKYIRPTFIFYYLFSFSFSISINNKYFQLIFNSLFRLSRSIN